MIDVLTKNTYFNIIAFNSTSDHFWTSNSPTNLKVHGTLNYSAIVIYVDFFIVGFFPNSNEDAKENRKLLKTKTHFTAFMNKTI